MSAGKGDSPRPVKGDDYRKNYDRIFAQRRGDAKKEHRMISHRDHPTRTVPPHP